MILNGNQRGNSRDMALHLLKEENERVEVFQIRGFASQNLVEALQESYAISRATQCKQHLYSLSLNPPKGAALSEQDFVDAIEQVEKELSLSGQPRAIIFHEKRGLDGDLRRHCHAVWCRIDIDRMRAIELPFTKLKLREVSRKLFIKHNWRMPDGLLDSKNRDPRIMTLAEWQQAKRVVKDPKRLKALFQDAWMLSDSKAALASALWEQGFVLAMGKRGHVAVDHRGEIYPISRWTGQMAKDVRQRLGEPDGLPSIEKAHAKAARLITRRLEEIRKEETIKAKHSLTASRREGQAIAEQHRMEAQELEQQQAMRLLELQAKQDGRIRKGFSGLLDRLSGKRKRTLKENRAELEKSACQARRLKAALRTTHRQSINALQGDATAQKAKYRAIEKELQQDIGWLERPPELFDETYNTKRGQRARQNKRDGPEIGR